MDVIGAPKGYTILSLSREKKISFSGMCRALHGLVSLGLLQEVELVEGRQPFMDSVLTPLEWGFNNVG